MLGRSVGGSEGIAVGRFVGGFVSILREGLAVDAGGGVSGGRVPVRKDGRLVGGAVLGMRFDGVAVGKGKTGPRIVGAGVDVGGEGPTAGELRLRSDTTTAVGTATPIATNTRTTRIGHNKEQQLSFLSLIPPPATSFGFVLLEVLVAPTAATGFAIDVGCFLALVGVDGRRSASVSSVAAVIVVTSRSGVSPSGVSAPTSRAVPSVPAAAAFRAAEKLSAGGTSAWARLAETIDAGRSFSGVSFTYFTLKLRKALDGGERALSDDEEESSCGGDDSSLSGEALSGVSVVDSPCPGSGG